MLLANAATHANHVIPSHTKRVRRASLFRVLSSFTCNAHVKNHKASNAEITVPRIAAGFHFAILASYPSSSFCISVNI